MIEVQQPQRVAYTMKEALELLPISRTTIYQLVKEGRLRSLRVGKKILIPVTAIDEFLGQ